MMKSIMHYEAAVADLGTILQLNYDIRKHFPHFAISPKPIKKALKKAKMALAKREDIESKKEAGGNRRGVRQAAR